MADAGNVALYDQDISWWMGVTGTQAPMAPVPEPKTAAAGLAALFVLGLVGRRLWVQRKAAAAAAVVAPAHSPGV